MVNILFSEDTDVLTGTSPIRHIYDPACGTGGMLNISDQHVTALNPNAKLEMFGQELNPDGIPADRRRAFPHEFSGGMRQRVVIAMALANDPSLLVADEPVTGLDVVTQAKILQLLLQLQDRFGMSLLLISHDLPLVAHAARCGSGPGAASTT